MRGVFTTTKYDDRAAYTEQRPSGVHVAYNRLTNAGLNWLWQAACGYNRGLDNSITDHLGKARLLVGDGELEFQYAQHRLAGEQTAQAPLSEGFPTIEVDHGVGRCRMQAVFGEREACFDWRERGVVSAQGVLIDRAVADGGRKILGSIWTLEVSLELTA